MYKIVKKIALSIRPDDRINVTDIRFDNSKFYLSVDEQYPHSNKPNAFYYAFGKQWMLSNNSVKGDTYLLNLDLSKIYNLTPENLKDFMEKYCSYIEEQDISNVDFTDLRSASPMLVAGVNVDWAKFKKDYDGLEIKNLNALKQKFETFIPGEFMPLLEAVEVEGGFFWNPKVLISATKIESVSDKSFKEDEVLRRTKLKDDISVL